MSASKRSHVRTPKATPSTANRRAANTTARPAMRSASGDINAALLVCAELAKGYDEVVSSAVLMGTMPRDDGPTGQHEHRDAVRRLVHNTLVLSEQIQRVTRSLEGARASLASEVSS